jgi:hypothetical protein
MPTVLLTDIIIIYRAALGKVLLEKSRIVSVSRNERYVLINSLLRNMVGLSAIGIFRYSFTLNSNTT